MNKKSKNKYWWVYIIFIILSSLIIYIALIKGSEFNFCKNWLNCESFLYTKPILTIVSLVIILISISEISKWNWLRKLFYFFRPFYKNCNTPFGKYFSIISILILIPGIIFSFFYYYQLLGESNAFSDYNFFDQLSYVIAYIGLLLTVRVYFEIKEGHTESLEDFIKILTEILSLSDYDDDIVIYSPTLFINEAHILQGLTNYRNTSYRKNLLKFENLKIFMLECNSLIEKIEKNVFLNLLHKLEHLIKSELKEFNIIEIENLLNEIKTFPINTKNNNFIRNYLESFKNSILDNIEEKKKNEVTYKLNTIISSIIKEIETHVLDSKRLKDASCNEFLSSLQNDDSQLNKFHKFSLIHEIPDKDGDKFNQYYREFAFFLYSLKDKILNNSNYTFNGNGGNFDEYHGTFAISNFSKGIYYLGSFDVYSNGESFFRGTYFNNKYLNKNKLRSLINEITKE